MRAASRLARSRSAVTDRALVSQVVGQAAHFQIRAGVSSRFLPPGPTPLRRVRKLFHLVLDKRMPIFQE